MFSKRTGHMEPSAWRLVLSMIFIASRESACATSAPCGSTVHTIDFQTPRMNFDSVAETTFPPVEWVIDEAQGLSGSRSPSQKKIPYTEDLASTHLAPNDYLAGYYGQLQARADPNTCVAYEFTSNRNSLVLDPPNSDNQVLEVDLPNGCIITECALQSRVKVEDVYDGKLEEATLSYRFKFGKNFDFAKGGKLPGFCGGPKCVTGCSKANGLAGFSARHMWQTCLKDRESEKKCNHKFLSYLYHKNKVELCGDEVTLADESGVYTPESDRWYTMTSYIKMNTAGPPERADEHKADGKIKTWIDDKLVLDEDTMEWRVYNNITISYVYFSVFYGGADYSWVAQGDHTIRFDDFEVRTGQCAPAGAKADYTKANSLARPNKPPVQLFRLKHKATLVSTNTIAKYCGTRYPASKCWAECLRSDACQSAVLGISYQNGKRAGTCCELKDSLASHRLTHKLGSAVLYPSAKREMIFPPDGWDDEGTTGRPDTCPNKLFGAPLGVYKYPKTARCQIPRKSRCSNTQGCCQGVLVCLYKDSNYATCERPGEYRPADADECVRAELGESCGDNNKCCTSGTDCQYLSKGKAVCTERQEPENPFPSTGDVECTLSSGEKCGGNMTFEALLRGNCCEAGLTCVYQKPTYSKCVAS